MTHGVARRGWTGSHEVVDSFALLGMETQD